MVAANIVEVVRRYLRAVREDGLPVAFGVVMGSQARGDARSDSDIDVIVVSPRFDNPRSREPLYQLWEVAADVDTRIEPIPCGEKQWEAEQATFLIEEGRREGEKVCL